MMNLALLSLIIQIGSANAASRRRQTPSRCCFHLNSVGVVNETVKEDHSGDLFLLGAFQQGGFCFDQTTKTIKDSLGNNCFMRSPKYEFECYTGAVGPTIFGIAPPGDDGKSKLVYDNGPGSFLACPFGAGSDQSYNIYSMSKTNTTGCLQVSLELADQTSQCSAGNSNFTTASSFGRRTTQAVLSGAESTSPILSLSKSLPVTDASSATGLAPTQTSSQVTASITTVPTASLTCSISPSAPSIAPFKLGFAEASAPDGIHDTSFNASITPTNSTIFQYSIPQSFDTSGDGLCALQFRMPFCRSLPNGYPCFGFSGSEQELLSNSGMIFTSIEDNGSVIWDNTALHQIFPGSKTVLGTFECGSAPSGSSDERKLSWIASSVRNFALEFMQAGVGPDAQFSDGVGAWIVPCS